MIIELFEAMLVVAAFDRLLKLVIVAAFVKIVIDSVITAAVTLVVIPVRAI